MKKCLDLALPFFTIQWHITALCDQACMHCYMVSCPEIYKRELKNELKLKDCKAVIDSLLSFCRVAKARPAINLTGGDPILRPDFWEILRYASFRGVRLSIMGNPFHLTGESISKMKQLGVASYQVSLDGMKQTHDSLRMAGSFDATIRAIKLLVKNDMRAVVMFTLSKKNYRDLFPVMRLVNSLGVGAFAFARMSRNSGIDTKISPSEAEFTPEEYRSLLLKVQKLINELKARGSKMKFTLKDHLWKLLLYEQGELKLESNPDGLVISGCHIGNSNITVLADGTVYACRRFNSPVGKVPKQSVLKVYTSKKLDNYRNIEKLEKCSKCPLLYHCRGCPATSYGASGGNVFAPDPQCWWSSRKKVKM